MTHLVHLARMTAAQRAAANALVRDFVDAVTRREASPNVTLSALAHTLFEACCQADSQSALDPIAHREWIRRVAERLTAFVESEPGQMRLVADALMPEGQAQA
jgi:hypothetical protein